MKIELSGTRRYVLSDRVTVVPLTAAAEDRAKTLFPNRRKH